MHRIDRIQVLIRLLDIFFSTSGLIVFSPLFLILFLFGVADTGSPIFRQQRIGLGKRPFTLMKFRTMRTDTISVPTHLASASTITQYGRVLRRTKLDELPQLWNVFKGEMSLVGPRPSLPSQIDLIIARDDLNVLSVRPGITGLSQINEIDMSTPQRLAQSDAEMIASMSIKNYFKYIFQTALGKGAGDRVK